MGCPMSFFCDICGALLPPNSQDTYCLQCQKNKPRQKPSASRDIFPFPHIRPGQKEFLNDVAYALREKGILMAHAPTGIGKTAAVLTAAIKEQDNHKIFFSQVSNHNIVLLLKPFKRCPPILPQQISFPNSTCVLVQNPSSPIRFLKNSVAKKDKNIAISSTMICPP